MRILLAFMIMWSSVNLYSQDPTQIAPSPYKKGFLRAIEMVTDGIDTFYLYNHVDSTAVGGDSGGGGGGIDSIYISNDTIYLRDGYGFVKVKDTSSINELPTFYDILDEGDLEFITAKTGDLAKDANGNWYIYQGEDTWVMIFEKTLISINNLAVLGDSIYTWITEIDNSNSASHSIKVDKTLKIDDVVTGWGASAYIQVDTGYIATKYDLTTITTTTDTALINQLISDSLAVFESTLTFVTDTALINQLISDSLAVFTGGSTEYIEPYVVSGDTIGFILREVMDTVQFVGVIDTLGGSGDSTASVANYTELRDLDNYESSLVVVNDWTYTGPDGNTYTTIGGIFKKVSTGTENGGTIIEGNYIWAREWDKIHVQPEWWEVGGYSFNGEEYTSKNTSQEGIYNDRDRINSAAQIGKVIELREGYTYQIDITVGLNEHILNMNRATLKRYAFTASTLTANFTTGNTSLTVSDSAPYRVGQIIAVMDNSGPYSGVLTDNSHVNPAGVTNVLTITSIVGNVINVSVTGTVNNTYVSGDSVVILCTMLNIGSEGCQVYNGNIDGNRADYPIEYWNCQYVITGSGFENEDMFVVKNLYVKDNSGECIGVSTGIIENVVLENSTGSLVHIGSSPLTEFAELGGRIFNCVAKNVCQSNEMTGAGGVYINHNEGAITFSVNSKNWVIDGLRVHTSGTGVLGSLDDNDDNISLYNSFAEDCQFVISGIGGSTPSDDGIVGNIKLLNNIFVDCGMLYAVSSGQAITNLTIRDNRFTNTMFVFSNLNGFEFTNNYVEDDTTFTWDYTNIYGDMNNSAGIRSYFFIGANNALNNIRITGNTFIGRKVGNVDVYTNGLYIPLVSAVNNTDDQGFFTAHKNIDIANNQIYYFPRGIAFAQSYVVVVYKEYQNIKIHNNTVKMNSTVINFQWAVMVLPGMECYDNVLIGQQGGRKGADTHVAHVLGLFNGSLNLTTNRGAQFYNNKVIGSNVNSVTVGQNNCDNKCLIYNNVTNVAIQDLTSGLSTFFNNTVSADTNILD